MIRAAVVLQTCRLFLGLVLVGSLELLAGCKAAPAEGRGRVVVVGAGLSGLTAALDLREAGWDVLVLEARDRVGGRVNTLYAPFSPGLHAESGGESIDDHHDNILALIKHFGLAVERRPADKLLAGLAYYQGKRSRMSDFIMSPSGVAGSYAGFSLSLLQLGLGLDPEHPEEFADAQKLDQRSLADFVSEQQLIPEAEFLVRTGNKASYASELGDVSLLFAVQQAIVVADVPDNAAETMRIAGGNSLLTQEMAKALGDRVHLNEAVTAIAEAATGVRVTTGDKVYEAAYVVLALPPPPLQKVTFSPPLPPDLSTLVQELALGPAVKVISEYQQRFWEPLSGFTVSDLPFGVSWPSTDSYSSQGGILSQFITGNAALDAAMQDEATRIHRFQQQLDQIYPEGAPLHSAHAATLAWSNEPFTGGGYAVYRPGQLLRFFPALRKGTPHIRFAGEHTEALAGYMESAVRSGHRVARELGSPEQ